MRDAVFTRAVRELQRNPRICTQTASSVVPDLVRAWGNAAWSAREDYLRDCIHHALATKGPVLECGSGLTTLVIGIIAQRCGYRCWALENSETWAARARAALARYNVTAVTISTSPLRTYDDFDWYDPPLATMPAAFRMVICDGPPGSTRGGRYGLVPVMRNRMARGCVILLDDADRPAERSIVKRWIRELEATTETNHGRHRHARLRLPV
jgi:hypothetical protein